MKDKHFVGCYRGANSLILTVQLRFKSKYLVQFPGRSCLGLVP